ncbi:MAG: phosphodiester glycosidase family protein [Bacillaceae bacterium]|nr:phosphodiester glycosidase family protein [Bacillaceae bacterium]
MAHTESTTENVYRLSNNIYSITRRDSQDLEQGQEVIQTLLIKSEEHKNQSLDVLDQILKNILGDPIDQTFTDKVAIKVFSLKEAGYRGYMAKVKIFDPEALKLVMAHDQIRSNGETTSSMAKRKGAILAINAGGFWTDENGKFAPVGTTVVDGEIKTFSTSSKVSFVGFNNEGRLIGGKIESREHLESMDILQGASFLPTLLKDGQKMPIPAEWANQKHPRTLIGHFENGDLLMIVIDGRRQGWSTGVTLEEAQDKLLEFNVRDAYNLDGGGSSTFFYKGEVLNKPSDGRERPVISSFVIIP